MDSISEVDAELADLPPSQFRAIRQAVIAAMSDGRTEFENFPLSDDCELMIRALRKFGWDIEVSKTKDKRIANVRIEGGIEHMEPSSEEIDLGSSGLGYRISMAIASLGVGTYKITGDNRMSERTVKDLEQAMDQLGVDVETSKGFPPVKVKGINKDQDYSFIDGAEVFLSGEETGQFHTAAIIAYCQNRSGLTIKSDNVVSQFYVELTKRLVEKSGIDIKCKDDFTVIKIGGGQSLEVDDTVKISSDIIMVSYFLFLTAFIGGSIHIDFPTRGGYSVDRLGELLRDIFNCEASFTEDGIEVISKGDYSSFEVNGNDIPFLVPTLSIMAVKAEDVCRIRNIKSADNKMTARKTESVPRVLRKIGAEVEITETDMIIDPGPIDRKEKTVIKTEDHENDHRIVMSLALLDCDPEFNVKIQNVENAVSKSFPSFEEIINEISRKSKTK